MYNLTYFTGIGYKWIDKYSDLIIKDFQRHVFPGQKNEWDGIIGIKTRAKMNYYNKNNFCPEVFEPIKPYISYTDDQIEHLMKPNLIGYGSILNREAKKNNFNVLHSIAHQALEASDEHGVWANSYIAINKNNIYGFGAYDLSPVVSAKKFSSFKECIEIWSVWFNKNYLLPTGKYYHGNSEYGVNHVYASSPVAGINKSFIIQQLRRQLNGIY